jgi:hypothetical protein
MTAPKPLRRGLAAVIAALFIADLLGLFSVLSRVSPVTVDTAVSRFRAIQRSGAQAVSPGAVLAPAAVPGPVLAAAQVPVGAGRAHATANTRSNRTSASGGRGGDAPAASVASAAQAGPGVYVYATDGFETLAVANGRHVYPAQTTMTVTANDRGRSIRWDGLDQRYDSWDTCAVGQGVRLRSFISYHSFYGQAVRRDYACTPSTFFRPDTDQPGTRFVGQCHSADGDAALNGVIVAVENLTVGGKTVPTVHVRVDEALTGGTKGTRTADSWYAVADNLLVKRNSVTDADTQTPFGYSHYHEDPNLSLTNLQPRQ